MSSSSSAGSENETLTVLKQPIIAEGKEGNMLLQGTIPGLSLPPVLFYKRFFPRGRDTTQQWEEQNDVSH